MHYLAFFKGHEAICETFHEKSIEKSRVIFIVLKTKLHKLQSRGNISCCSFSFCLDNLYEQSCTYNLHRNICQYQKEHIAEAYKYESEILSKNA